MSSFIFRPLRHCLTTLSSVTYDIGRLLVLAARSRRALAAENLYLRKQLALLQERKVKPRRVHDFTRLMMLILGRIVGVAFPRNRVADFQPLSGGLRNSNFKVELDSAPGAVVLRIYEHDPSICRKEVELLKRNGFSVPVPKGCFMRNSMDGTMFRPWLSCAIWRVSRSGELKRSERKYGCELLSAPCQEGKPKKLFGDACRRD